ncbi:MAG: hypothetical protein HY528_02215 [Chloroflexi bacterium]|nr:hypothetical protein [Chloroflexota bacterium]
MPIKVKSVSIAQKLLKKVGAVTPFPKSQLPYPLNQSLFGELNLEALRHQAKNNDGAGFEDELPLLLAIAEAVEASQPDKEEFFIPDRELRARLLRLNSTDGWALVWGAEDEKTNELATRLQQEHLQVYTVLADDNNAPSPLKTNKQFKFLGSRPTSSIYFYQALVRYAHIYGRIPLGEAHEAIEFIQEYGPGVMFLTREKLTPLEKALFLGGLDLSIPAVVPSSFTLPQGAVLRADNPQAMVNEALSLGNLRLRRRLRFQVNIPYNFDVAFTAEEIKEGPSIGGTALSSFVVTNIDKGDGVEIKGEPGADVGIEIAVGDPRVDITMTDYLEEFATRLINYIDGVSATVKEGCPIIRWRPDLPLQMAELGQTYYDGLKAHFRIDHLKVRLVFSSELLGKMKTEAESFRERRKQVIAAATEETEPFFYACTRCHAHALEHVCIITPERPPQCGPSSRTWMHVKTRAILSDFDSVNLGVRQSGSDLQAVIKKGRYLNTENCEWEGVNAAAELFTEGRTKRVFLHSIFDHPHTACSCFKGIAYYIKEVDGIGLMHQAYEGTTPDGKGWDDLANAASGKQSSGYAPFAREYLSSSKFLQGDGGWPRVVWMTQELKTKFAPEKNWIATETDVKNLPELTRFLNARRGCGCE